jgi:hypothetical protein
MKGLQNGGKCLTGVMTGKPGTDLKPNLFQLQNQAFSKSPDEK